MPDEPSSRDEVLLLAILVEGGLIVLAWLLGWMLGLSPLDRFRWDGWGAAFGVLACVPMVLLFLLMNRWPIGPLRGIKSFGEKVLRPLLAPCSLTDLAGIALLAGLGEEMLFRGVLQDWLVRHFPNPWLAILFTAVLFGLLHAVSASYAVLAGLAGVWLGWLYLATGNLLAPSITHALYDFVVLVYLLRGPGSDVELPDEEEEEEPDTES
jgi:membrane protease YdiL (CAAX protease family)